MAIRAHSNSVFVLLRSDLASSRARARGCIHCAKGAHEARAGVLHGTNWAVAVTSPRHAVRCAARSAEACHVCADHGRCCVSQPKSIVFRKPNRIPLVVSCGKTSRGEAYDDVYHALRRGGIVPNNEAPADAGFNAHSVLGCAVRQVGELHRLVHLGMSVEVHFWEAVFVTGVVLKQSKLAVCAWWRDGVHGE